MQFLKSCNVAHYPLYENSNYAITVIIWTNVQIDGFRRNYSPFLANDSSFIDGFRRDYSPFLANDSSFNSVYF